MTTLLSVLLLLSYFAICGRAWLAAWGVRLGHARSWLLAPTLGVALNVVPVLSLNQAGFPIASFARPFVVTLFVLSCVILIWRRQGSVRGLGVFVWLAIAALMTGGWPLLRYGTQWLGYGNDDMVNYCLAAQRLLHNGFYRVPELSELLGRDYTQYYWFMYAVGMVRSGSEALLALVAGATHRLPLGVFMPVIFSLALTQLWALAGLLYSCPKKKKLAVLACGLLAVSPLWTYSTLLQLIAQVGGLALLLTTLFLTTRRRYASTWAGRLRQAGVIALPLAGISVIYPEVIPFLILGIGLWSVIRMVRTKALVPNQISVALLSTGLLVLFLRYGIASTIATVLDQTSGGFKPDDLNMTIFPYFVVPRGISYLAGFEAIGTFWSEPWGSVCIGTGLVLLGIILTRSGRHALQAIPSSCLFIVMALVAVKLFRGDNAFGLLKIALFITPLLVIEIATGLRQISNRTAFACTTLCLVGLWLYVGQIYVRITLPTFNDSSVELSEALFARKAMPDGSVPLISDLTTMPAAKLSTVGQHGVPIYFLSRPFFEGLSAIVNDHWYSRFTPDPHLRDKALRLTERLYAQLPEIPMFGTKIRAAFIPKDQSPVRLLTSNCEQRSFNKLKSYPLVSPGLYRQIDTSELANHLVFIHSAAGQHYYLSEPGRLSVYRPQLDTYANRETVFPIGRKLIFEVLNPSPTVRLRFGITNTLLGPGLTQLPEKTAVQGAGEPSPLALLGHGSANVFSQPIKPLIIDGRAYVAFDLGRIPVHMARLYSTGLNRIYNSTVNLNPTLLNGFCRDISAVSEDEYQKLSRPRVLQNFPGDLVGQPGLEYSGLYEDGWVSPRAFVVLAKASTGERLRIKGQIPGIGRLLEHGQTLKVLINGQVAREVHLPAGDFSFDIPLAPVTAKDQTRVDLLFAETLALPSPDDRPASAKVAFLGLVGAP